MKKAILAALMAATFSAQADIVTLNISAGNPLFQVNSSGTAIGQDDTGLITGTVKFTAAANTFTPITILDFLLTLPGGQTINMGDITNVRSSFSGGEISCHADHTISLLLTPGQRDCYVWWVDAAGGPYLADTRAASPALTGYFLAGQGSAPNHVLSYTRIPTDVPISGSLSLLVAGMGGMLLAARRRFPGFIPE